jgi:hypothetical protein
MIPSRQVRNAESQKAVVDAAMAGEEALRVMD